MTPLDWIAAHGIVMQSAQHAHFPSLVSFIAGEPIRGSWWAHEKGRDIFRALTTVYESGDVAATRLVDGKLTLLHRRVWAALATLAREGRIASERLGRVREEHTASGRHESHVEPFPDWLPRGLQLPGYDAAVSELGAATVELLVAKQKSPTKPKSPAKTQKKSPPKPKKKR